MVLCIFPAAEVAKKVTASILLRALTFCFGKQTNLFEMEKEKKHIDTFRLCGWYCFYNRKVNTFLAETL